MQKLEITSAGVFVVASVFVAYGTSGVARAAWFDLVVPLLAIGFVIASARAGYRLSRTRPTLALGAGRDAIIFVGCLIVLAGGLSVLAFLVLDLPLDIQTPALQVSGVAVFALAVLFMRRSYRDLGASFSGGFDWRPGAELVVTGTYGKVRHPQFLAYVIFACSLCLFVSPALVPIPVAVAALLEWAARAEEEHTLASAVGQQYERYMQATRNRMTPGDRFLRI